jgi:hypothetical protein
VRELRQHRAGYNWWRSRVKIFGNPEKLRQKIAMLNIGAYHSKNLAQIELIASLPSSRLSIEWAQTVLFPQALRGERVVICLRAARFWGLGADKDGKRYGRALYAPVVTRGGHMRKGRMRNEIVNVVKRAVGDT